MKVRNVDILAISKRLKEVIKALNNLDGRMNRSDGIEHELVVKRLSDCGNQLNGLAKQIDSLASQLD